MAHAHGTWCTSLHDLPGHTNARATPISHLPFQCSVCTHSALGASGWSSSNPVLARACPKTRRASHALNMLRSPLSSPLSPYHQSTWARRQPSACRVHVCGDGVWKLQAMRTTRLCGCVAHNHAWELHAPRCLTTSALKRLRTPAGLYRTCSRGDPRAPTRSLSRLWGCVLSWAPGSSHGQAGACSRTYTAEMLSCEWSCSSAA